MSSPSALRPEANLARRTVRIIVLPLPEGRVGVLSSTACFSLRVGPDGWVEVRERLAGPTESLAGHGAEGDGGDHYTWPMLLRSLAEVEEVVCVRAGRLGPLNAEEAGDGGSREVPSRETTATTSLRVDHL